MKLVPIADENLDFIKLDLSRHYLQVDIDFTAYIVLNPSGSIPKGGSDICVLHVGAWQIDTWSFLTDKFTKDTPGFSACLVWDKSLITSIAKAPQVAESDIDTANSISSLKGQPVNITGFSMAEGESLPVKTLDNTWVAVKSFEDYSKPDAVPFPVQKFWKRFKVGDDLVFLPEWVIERGDDFIKLYPPVCLGGVTTSATSRTVISWNYNYGFCQLPSAAIRVGADCMVLPTDNSFVRFGFNSDNLITSIDLSADVFGIHRDSGALNVFQTVLTISDCPSVVIGN